MFLTCGTDETTDQAESFALKTRVCVRVKLNFSTFRNRRVNFTRILQAQEESRTPEGSLSQEGLDNHSIALPPPDCLLRLVFHQMPNKTNRTRLRRVLVCQWFLRGLKNVTHNQCTVQGLIALPCAEDPRLYRKRAFSTAFVSMSSSEKVAI